MLFPLQLCAQVEHYTTTIYKQTPTSSTSLVASFFGNLHSVQLLYGQKKLTKTSSIEMRRVNQITSLRLRNSIIQGYTWSATCPKGERAKEREREKGTVKQSVAQKN